jgi:hypothetical protein
MPDGPFSGLLVVDLTRVLAGPFSTMVLAELGGQRAGCRGLGAVVTSPFHCGTCGCHCSHS